MSKLGNIVKGARREAAAKMGAYDGRFGHRVYTDRKKEYERTLCRQGVDIFEEDVTVHEEATEEAVTYMDEGFSHTPFS